MPANFSCGDKPQSHQTQGLLRDNLQGGDDSGGERELGNGGVVVAVGRGGGDRGQG